MFAKLPSRLFAAFLLASAALPATAQTGPVGIAFSYAPEQGSGMCVGGNPSATLDCARRACVESSGALAEDCLRVAWCFPAGWSVAVGLMHEEGLHWTEFSCGWPSQEAALVAGEVLCDRELRQGIQDCVVARLWDDDGNEVEIDDE